MLYILLRKPFNPITVTLADPIVARTHNKSVDEAQGRLYPFLNNGELKAKLLINNSI